MAEPRTGHPYHMHDAILAQPGAFGEVVRRSAAAVEALAAGIDPGGRLFLVGTGTSLHAALVGEHLFRLHGAGREARAVPAFDFALDGPALTAQDTVVVLSHRGTKQYSVAALQRACAAGCRTALICGQGAPPSPVAPDAVLPTVPQELSSAHTISYAGALAALAALAGAVGRRAGRPTLDGVLLTGGLPALLAGALAAEPEVAALAARHAGHRRIWIAGAGVDAVTAAEIALKIKESSYLQAEGMAAEAMLHGPFQCLEAADLVILIATARPGVERLEALARMAEEVGAARLWVGSAQAPGEGCDLLAVPEAPAPLSCLTCLVPLQLLAYHLALTRGTDPDAFRLNDPRFARAARHARL